MSDAELIAAMTKIFERGPEAVKEFMRELVDDIAAWYSQEKADQFCEAFHREIVKRLPEIRQRYNA